MNFNIGPIMDGILNTCIGEIKKPETKEKIINNLISPFIKDIYERYNSYFALLIIAFLIIVISQIMIIKKIYKL